MTFVVPIQRDTDAKWHDAFETASRISVNEAGQKYPVATAIKSAPKP